VRIASPSRTGAALLAAGALPFAVAPAIHGADGLDVPCPFLAATGMPCPLCGGTRAVALAANGDAAFLDYGAVWVVVLLVLAVFGIAALAGRRPRLSRPVPLVLGTLAVAWAWALANAGTIAA
jgi:Protein of unknown function (DUF2752)